MNQISSETNELKMKFNVTDHYKNSHLSLPLSGTSRKLFPDGYYFDRCSDENKDFYCEIKNSSN